MSLKWIWEKWSDGCIWWCCCWRSMNSFGFKEIFCNWIFLKPCYRFVLNLHISNLGLSSFDVQKLKIQNYGPWSFLLSILVFIWKQNRKKLTYFVDSWWIFPSFMMKILTQSEFFTPYSKPKIIWRRFWWVFHRFPKTTSISIH